MNKPNNDSMASIEKTESTESTGSIEWMARNSIAANLLMLILLAGGIWMAFEVQKEVFPEYQLGVVEIDVRYPGASPEEVEQGVLLPVEEAVRGVKGIKDMTSQAREGTGRIHLDLVAGINQTQAFQEIDQAIKRIQTFPDAAEEPEVRLESQQREVMEIGLFGDIDIWSLRKLAEQTRDRLLSEPGITQVELNNVPNYMIHIDIPQHALRQYQLTLADVAQKIDSSGRDIPAGAIDTSHGQILLRMEERRHWAQEFVLDHHRHIPQRRSDYAGGYCYHL